MPLQLLHCYFTCKLKFCFRVRCFQTQSSITVVPRLLSTGNRAEKCWRLVMLTVCLYFDPALDLAQMHLCTRVGA